MKKLLLIVFAIFVTAVMIVMAMRSCDATPNVLKSQEIDTLAMINKIHAYETQPIGRIKVFQVFEGRQFSQEYCNYYKCCLAETFKYNAKGSIWDGHWERVNESAMIYVFDESVMLYNDLEIKADDYIMIGTYSYDTKPSNFFGTEIPSRRLTVPIYVRKSELLGLFGVVLPIEQPKTNKPKQKQPENKPVQQPEVNTRALFTGK